MNEEELKKKVQNIVMRATSLKDKYVDDKNVPVNYACIFSQNDKEYGELVRVAHEMGDVVKETPTGLLFRISPLKTVAGDLRLLKIRLSDAARPELGDADFTISNFLDFKKKVLSKSEFKLIKREDFEMVELVDPGFDVRAYFSNPPLDKQLDLK